MVHIKPGSLIVFEGLDKSGKSTQAVRLLEASRDTAAIHMPSGVAEVSRMVYNLMEKVDSIQPLARQLLHLACHAENMSFIHEQWERRGLILDRWWWSTMAYGYFGAELDTSIPAHTFMNTLAMVWSGVRADVVFVGLETYSEDRHNNPSVFRGYEQLVQQNTSAVVLPRGTEDEVHEYVVQVLKERDLCSS